MLHNKSKETNQKPACEFLIAHFKRYIKVATLSENLNMPIYENKLVNLK